MVSVESAHPSLTGAILALGQCFYCISIGGSERICRLYFGGSPQIPFYEKLCTFSFDYFLVFWLRFSGQFWLFFKSFSGWYSVKYRQTCAYIPYGCELTPQKLWVSTDIFSLGQIWPKCRSLLTAMINLETWSHFFIIACMRNDSWKQTSPKLTCNN